MAEPVVTLYVMVYYDPRKPKPWPIRILNNWGVKNDTTASHIVIGISIVFLSIAATLLISANTEETIDRDLSEQERSSIGL